VNSSAKADVSKTREDRIAVRRPRRSEEGLRVRASGGAHASETGRKALYVNVAHTVRFAA
jgi:taurine dioxygenase